MINYSVILLDCETMQSQVIAKQFSNLNYTVIGVSRQRFGFGHGSKYFDKIHIVPKYEKFLDFYINIFGSDLSQRPVILPCNDNGAQFLSKNYQTIDKYFISFTPDAKTFDNFNNKLKFNKLLRNSNLPNLPFISADDSKNLNFLTFPVLFKPLYSMGARGFKIFKNRNDLVLELDQLPEEGLLQNFIMNIDYHFKCTGFIFGEKVEAVVTEKTRQFPIKAGSSALSVNTQRSDIIKLCKTLLEENNWFGPFDFDLIEVNKTIYLIELNPRFPACVKLSKLAGLDYAIIINNIIQKRNKNTIISYEAIKLYSFSLSIARVLNGKVTELLELFVAIFKREKFQDLDFTDYKSFIYGYFDFLLRIKTKFMR